ncbi:porin family protein [Agriterribacter sp.]|uniref:porin family protein n=1 Tax=Agriterribacter sp. TaxID=2821509 RepID=UPI002CA9A53C|nr:porin family protein [Agriterribacter sp.]HRO47479.1 porin family protein [Agriterribacter sp.]HRQ18606.1 porin family protein [Agriterribacter sp.]
MKKANLKLLVVIICITLTTAAKAQVQLSAGPEVGFTAAGIYSADDDVFAGINGHFGGTLRLQFGNYLAVRPSVLFKLGSMTNTDYDDTKISMTRISVPIPVMYSQIFGNNSNLFVGLGPNLMYALSGKMKNSYGSGDISFGSNPGQWKPFDVGLHLKGGFQFPVGIALSTFCNFGFTNLANNGDKAHTLDAIGFSVGYMFGGNAE